MPVWGVLKGGFQGPNGAQGALEVVAEGPGSSWPGLGVLGPGKCVGDWGTFSIFRLP